MKGAILAILAGGEGSRMGVPKASLRLRNRPILEYLLDRFGWPGPVWLITAPGREHPPGCALFDRELIDPVAGLGPLRGILTALDHADAGEVVIATVDMPEVTTASLQWFRDALHDRTEALAIVCRRQEGAEERVEPFPIALRPAAAPIIRRRLETGRRSVRGLIEEPGFMALPCPDWPARMWLNLNEPADLKDLEQ